MRVIKVRNVHQALPIGVRLLQEEGVRVASRVGTAWEHPEPVATVLERPAERVLFWPERDANPVFHILETLHMIAGRNDVEWLAAYNSRMREYSDDGMTFHGAYGYRWRYQFGVDQLDVIVDMLRRDPASRRVVLQMWHAPLDLGTSTKDTPCNDLVMYKIRDGALLATVCCRSNDIIWGAYGANAVHFSFLQEYLAARIGVRVGAMSTLSDSFHAYEGVWEKVHGLRVEPCPYELGKVSPYPIADELTNFDAWHEDLKRFMDVKFNRFKTPFFENVVYPLYNAYWKHKDGKTTQAAEYLEANCAASDWRKAGVEWLRRRVK
jgi:thymidylate synthase